MEERVTLVGGRLQIQSSDGEGTCLRAQFPLKWRPFDPPSDT
jgi:signal transduction histidine kinase